jgi:hypothetical protein
MARMTGCVMAWSPPRQDDRIAGFHRLAHIALDEIPRIGAAVEADIATIRKATRAEIDARLAPHTIGVGAELAADDGGRLGGPPHEGGVFVMGDSQERYLDHLAHLPRQRV